MNDDLEGTIPTEIFQLTNLETLSLALNAKLGGSIRSEFGVLTNLRWLSLGASDFTGRFAAVPRCSCGID
jgi:hypothetical protein